MNGSIGVPPRDQHVWRAFQHLVTDSGEVPLAAPADWAAWRAYAKWFSELASEAAVPSWLADRALWAFGKALKRERQHAVAPPPALPEPQEAPEWLHEITFGSRHKSFWWRLDGKDVEFKRQFAGGKVAIKRLTFDELQRLQDGMRLDEWLPLANDVAKLGEGSEKRLLATLEKTSV